MKKIIYTLTLLLFSFHQINAQKIEVVDPELVSGTYYGEVQLFMDYTPSPSLSDFFFEREDKKWGGNVHNNPAALPNGVDPALQKEYGQSLTNLASLGVNMDGVTSSSLNANFSPPDPALDVGPNHVIQMSNAPGGSSVRIFDKTGKPLTNVLTFDTNFFPAAEGAGDPIVLYDPLADRWVLTEFSSSGPNLLYVAVSSTPDPVPPATWHVYSFQAPNFPDYPKYGVWPDAYYVTTNEDGPSAVYALPRVEMLAGTAAPSAQRFTMPSLPGFGFQAATPVDIDGTAGPAANSPGLIMRMADDAVQNGGAAVDQLEIWEFDVDWDNPANTSLTNSINLPTQPFSSELCGFSAFECFPQQGSNVTLDPLREVLMYRVQYRNFGTHETLICNHVTDVGDFTDHGGLRWYELRRTGGGAWSIHQQGTYAPDANHRWMGGAAMDGNGNIGMAYSVSSSSMFPSIRFTGRLATDNLGDMTITETSIVEGTGASSSERWGDYHSISVDPSDDCTFWFTGEYHTNSGWATRIASFQINCAPTAPTAAFSASNTEVCLADEKTVTFTDASSGVPTSWAWTFQGGTPSTSNQQTPTVTYNTPGVYDVTLVATNDIGTDTETKQNMITVTAAATCFSETVCATIMSTDVPKTIDEDGTPTITSTLTVTSTDLISDINVIDLTGIHSFIGDLSFSLTSPAGTSLIIINNKCGSRDNFDLSLDDDTTGTIPCPYTGGNTYRPDSPLAAFIGENPMGEWTLTISDAVDQDGGSLTTWGLEICHENSGLKTCEGDNLTLSTVVSKEYVVTQTITSNAVVANGATVFYQAGTTITLNTPFSVPLGATFTANIENCAPSGALTDEEKAAQQRQSKLQQAAFVPTPKPKRAGSTAFLELHISPNPLQYKTNIGYKVPEDGKVYLSISNALGQEIARLENGVHKTRGIYRVEYEFNNQENGIYFATLMIGKQQVTKRMLLLK